MSLIKCPECKKKISDTVISCPKCGYSIFDNLSSINDDLQRKACKRNRRKRKIKRLVKRMVIASIIFVSLVILTYNLNDGEVEKYPLFEDCVVTANKLLNKNINPILNGYIENKDYTITTNNNSMTYTFPFDNFELGTEPNLVIYTSSDDSKISKVQYTFRIENGPLPSYSHSLSLHRVISNITQYYDADPVYTYLNSNNNHVEISDDEFNLRNRKTTYYITWKSSEGKAAYSCTNLYNEKKEYGNLIFTKE